MGSESRQLCTSSRSNNMVYCFGRLFQSKYSRGGGLCVTPKWSMLAIFWNHRGLCHAAKIWALKELCNSHRPNLLFISESKISNTLRIQRISNSLKFDDVYFVLAQGATRRLMLLWKNEINVQVVTDSDNYISAMILIDPDQHLWLLKGVYEPTNLLSKPSF